MAFKKNDKVLLTAKILRKNPETGNPETLNFTDEAGTIEKLRIYKKDPSRNSYWIKTKYGVNLINDVSKFKLAP